MSEELDVLEFGPATAAPATRRRPGWRAMTTDTRLTTGLAVLGGAAAVASLVGEWQIIDTTRSGDEYFASIPHVTNSVWAATGGTPYLGGLMLLGAATAVALFGPVAARATARVAALGTSAVLVMVLAAAASVLSSTSELPRTFGGFMNSELLSRFSSSPGRGMWAALAAVALLGLAMLSAHRHEPAPAVGRHAAVEDAERDDHGSGDIELTVTTAAPFLRQY
ncbi:hypothetical protein [Catellatospora chokoriensis]|uniref:Uncharacterized protein n=1 Tax=Catellatospora chokoriensis TaxID=310353 RepID=A0A8J3JXN5_9ACTN|nr:hypothetical protein [Catellatospora chokoriensis]GIF88717.1 hypothetical protein Cch02nite_21610 [Catellatospora chokoriensis]